MFSARSGALLFVLLTVGSGAHAQEIDVSEPTISRGQGWSVLGAKTIGEGNTAVAAQLGWPGISATLLRGVADKFDIGARVGFNYGYEGDVSRIASGLRVQGVIRYTLLDTARANLGISFAPGPFFYFFRSYTDVGLLLPIGVQLGLPVSSAINLIMSVDMPLWVLFGPAGRVSFPILFGLGVEYFIDQHLLVSFNARMGPTLNTGSSRAYFTLETLLGVGYRF